MSAFLRIKLSQGSDAAPAEWEVRGISVLEAGRGRAKVESSGGPNAVWKGARAGAIVVD